MAIPTVTSITPGVGDPVGGMVVRIDGTNFRTPPMDHGQPGEPQTVRVTFGTFVSVLVRAFSSTRLEAVVPPWGGSPLALPTEAVDVTVQNLDSDLVPIPGEVVVKVKAWLWTRRVIGQVSGGPRATSLLQAAVEEVVGYFKSRVCERCGISAAQEFPEGWGEIADVDEVLKAGLPAVYLSGPALEKDTDQDANERIKLATSEHAHPVPKRLLFGVTIWSESQGELLGLIQHAVLEVERTPWLRVHDDPADPSSDYGEYHEFRWTTDPAAQTIPTASRPLYLARGQLLLGGLMLAEGDRKLETIFPAERVDVHAAALPSE